MANIEFDEFLSYRLPEGFSGETSFDDGGRKTVTFHSSSNTDVKYMLKHAGKEAELEESLRNLKGRFHFSVTAKLGETPALLWTNHYLLAAVVMEHHRHCYLLTDYKVIQNREDLESFAETAAAFLNDMLALITIDGETAEAEEITAQKLLELADVAEFVDEETANAEEQQRAAEIYAREHPDGEGISFRAVYRDPITGKMKRDLFWERAGAESGDPEAMIKLALAYLNGDGVEQSNEKAAEYMRQAAELDEPTAQYNMGMFYIQGCGVERDFSQAEHWMKLASDNGDGDADPILKSLRELPSLREKAQGDDPEAKVELARQLTAMKGDANYAEAFSNARKAAEAGSLDAMWILGLAYSHGRGVEQSYKDAFSWYLKAAEAGHAPSQANLACLYARGDGVKKDMRKAEEWVRKSAEQGDPDGIRLLQNIDPQRAMELERTAWEEKWRRQQEEEQKQRAAEWMKNYGRYLEKDPRIVINGSKFVFTGVLEENWNDILQKLLEKGGVERGAVSGKTDYLVVDPRGYGESKVKEALAQRIKGKDVKIVLMEDFLKALGMGKPTTGAEITSQTREQKQTPAQRSLTPKQIENRGFMDDIVAFMEPGVRYTAEDIAKSVPSIVAAGISQNRVSAYLIQLTSDGTLEKKDDGAKRYYSLPGTEAELLAQEKAEKEKKEREAEARRQEEERRKEEEAHRQEEERRKAEEARRQEEARRKAEEARRQEEERRRAEEARRQEEERRKAEEARQQEEERRRAEEARRQEEERRRNEKAAERQESTESSARDLTADHSVKVSSGVSKTVLILAIALTLVTGILIGVLVSHAMRGTQEKVPSAGLAHQETANNSSVTGAEGTNEGKPELNLQSIIQQSTASASDFVYVSNGSEIQINGYNGTASELVIPDEIEGQPVTRIGPQAFSHCETIRTVQLPSRLVEIGDMAFGYLDIEGILVLPSTLEKVGGHAFASTKLTGLVIQSSCRLEVNAFANISELEFIYVTEASNPDIGTAVFSYAKACAVALLPESMNSIKDETFSACTQLVIYTKPGSYAEDYARRNFIQCNTKAYNEVLAEFVRVYGSGA